MHREKTYQNEEKMRGDRQQMRREVGHMSLSREMGRQKEIQIDRTYYVREGSTEEREGEGELRTLSHKD